VWLKQVREDSSPSAATNNNYLFTGREKHPKKATF